MEWSYLSTWTGGHPYVDLLMWEIGKYFARQSRLVEKDSGLLILAAILSS